MKNKKYSTLTLLPRNEKDRTLLNDFRINDILIQYMILIKVFVIITAIRIFNFIFLDRSAASLQHFISSSIALATMFVIYAVG